MVSALVRMDRAKANYSALGDARWFEKATHTLPNGDWTVAAEPWAAPTSAAVTDDVLRKIAADIQRRYQPQDQGDMLKPAEPWSPKIEKRDRSVKNVLERHNIN